MKKLMILIGITLSLGAKADLIARMPVLDYSKTNYDYVWEIKTEKYQKVLLDCQGFIMGMSFYYNGQQERKVFMDDSTCQDVFTFIKDSKDNKEPVCMELNADQNSLVFSRKTDDCK